MYENYPAGIRVSIETIDLECPQCDHSWSASVTIELNMISEDYYDICPQCGARSL